MNNGPSGNGYWQQGYDPQNQYDNRNYPPHPQRVIQPKNLAMCIILSVLTCGIYSLFWVYSIAEDMNAVTGDRNAPGGGMVILLSLVTCGIYEIVWLYRQGEKLDNIKIARGQAAGNSSILYLVLALVGLGIVAYALIQDEINTIVS